MNNPPVSLLSSESIASLRLLAESSPAGGCFVEVGVYRGGAAWHLAEIARRQGRILHLFDTFAGIPERRKGFDKTHKKGDFGDTSFEAVKSAIPDAIYHVGVFPGTMPEDIEPISFVHVDCDQYDATRNCAAMLLRPMLPGGIMLFDDYNAVEGATAAVDAMFEPRFLFKTAQEKAYVIKAPFGSLEYFVTSEDAL